MTLPKVDVGAWADKKLELEAKLRGQTNKLRDRTDHDVRDTAPPLDALLATCLIAQSHNTSIYASMQI